MSPLSDQSAPAVTSAEIIGRDSVESWKDLNRKPFAFRHNLADNPLFQLPELAKLVKAAIKRGDPLKMNARIDDPAPELKNISLSEKLLRATELVEAGGASFKLSNVEELDPAYREILDQTIEEVGRLIGSPLRQDIPLSGATVFVTAPHMVTPYHFDHDTNFLFQIRGEKDVRLFDGGNRRVLSESDIELFYSGAPVVGEYRDELLQWSELFHLTPGDAVHHPPLAPHLVSTGNAVSISVSLWFTLPAQMERARIYQANYCLRHMGLQPVPPGRSQMRDQIKAAMFNAIVKKNPETFDDLIYSGMNRLKAPFRFAGSAIQRIRNA